MALTKTEGGDGRHISASCFVQITLYKNHNSNRHITIIFKLNYKILFYARNITEIQSFKKLSREHLSYHTQNRGIKVH